MVKSGLEKIILKFNDGLQSCCCPVQINLPRKAELAWQVSRYLWRPPLNFKTNFSKLLFTIILSQKWCQISVRIFRVLSGNRNLQCTPGQLNYCVQRTSQKIARLESKDHIKSKIRQVKQINPLYHCCICGPAHPHIQHTITELSLEKVNGIS